MYSIQNQYSLPKDIFNKYHHFLGGFVFNKDLNDNTVIFRFATKAFAKYILPQLDEANVPYTLLEEKFA